VQHAVDFYPRLTDAKDRTRTKVEILGDLRAMETKGQTIGALLTIALHDADNDLRP